MIMKNSIKNILKKFLFGRNKNKKIAQFGYIEERSKIILRPVEKKKICPRKEIFPEGCVIEEILLGLN